MEEVLRVSVREGGLPRDDRTPERRVFQGFGGDRFRTAVTRACVAAGVPAFSPHDLRHRRISLLHLGGVPWARIGEHVGQRNLAVTENTYSHVLADEAELDSKRCCEPVNDRSHGAYSGACLGAEKARLAGMFESRWGHCRPEFAPPSAWHGDFGRAPKAWSAASGKARRGGG